MGFLEIVSTKARRWAIDQRQVDALSSNCESNSPDAGVSSPGFNREIHQPCLSQQRGNDESVFVECSSSMLELDDRRTLCSNCDAFERCLYNGRIQHFSFDYRELL